MKADYVHKDTRTIVVDGVEIQTSLTAVEIASLQQENQELKKQLEEKNKTKIFVEQNLEEAYGDGLYLEHLEKENQQLKEQLEASEKARKDAIEFINGVFYMSLYTKSKSLDEEGIEEILDILDIDKGE